MPGPAVAWRSRAIPGPDRSEGGEMRIGQGFDVHALASGRRLIIGGVEIAHDRGLVGHSDADVLAHAVCDALLGAAGLGDIGRHFPDTDPSYRDADSMVLLEQVVQRVRASGWEPVNVDATVIAQAPRLAPHIPRMEERLRACIGCPVNVKAKTMERLGALGRGEGIAAEAIALLAPGGSY